MVLVAAEGCTADRRDARPRHVRATPASAAAGLLSCAADRCYQPRRFRRDRTPRARRAPADARRRRRPAADRSRNRLPHGASRRAARLQGLAPMALPALAPAALDGAARGPTNLAGGPCWGTV